MDISGYLFVLLVASLIAFIKFYLGGGPKREVDLSAFDYKHPTSTESKEKDTKGEVIKKQSSSSSLRLRNVKQPGEEVESKLKEPEKIKESKETKGEAKSAAEIKEEIKLNKEESFKEPQKTKADTDDEAEKVKKANTAASADDEIDGEEDDGDDEEEEDEDEDDDDEDDEDEDEDEEKDLREVILNYAKSKVLAASVSLQGKRPKNEDRSVVQATPHPLLSAFAIFDGHDGKQASEYCSKFMIKNITTQKSFPASITKSLRRGFMKTDRKFLDKVESGGSTAVVAILKHSQGDDSYLFVANAGDSRCVVSIGGKAVALSVDHKPDLPTEQQRIQKTMHEVQQSVEIVQGQRIKIARIDGTLAVSRAIGDSDFKDERDKSAAEQAVSPVPEIQKVKLTPEHEFAVLACDGLWDVLSNQEVVDFVRSKITSATTVDDVTAVTKSLVTHAIEDKHSTDNVTALIIKF